MIDFWFFVVILQCVVLVENYESYKFGIVFVRNFLRVAVRLDVGFGFVLLMYDIFCLS